jgi:hypothetical protein
MMSSDRTDDRIGVRLPDLQLLRRVLRELRLIVVRKFIIVIGHLRLRNDEFERSA